jgi:hypothetical protein
MKTFIVLVLLLASSQSFAQLDTEINLEMRGVAICTGLISGNGYIDYLYSSEEEDSDKKSHKLKATLYRTYYMFERLMERLGTTSESEVAFYKGIISEVAENFNNKFSESPDGFSASDYEFLLECSRRESDFYFSNEVERDEDLERKVNIMVKNFAVITGK